MSATGTATMLFAVPDAGIVVRAAAESGGHLTPTDVRPPAGSATHPTPRPGLPWAFPAANTTRAVHSATRPTSVALSATVYNSAVELSDVDRNVYDTLAL